MSKGTIEIDLGKWLEFQDTISTIGSDIKFIKETQAKDHQLYDKKFDILFSFNPGIRLDNLEEKFKMMETHKNNFVIYVVGLVVSILGTYLGTYFLMK